MNKRYWAFLRRLARGTRGMEITEFALILPLLALLLFGIFWFGQAFRIYGAITNAARDGARAAVAPACTTCTADDPTTNAWNVIQNDLKFAHIDPTVLQQPANPPALCACAANGPTTGCTSTTVACDGSQTNICVQGVSHPNGNTKPAVEGNVQLSSTGGGGAGECGISVSFQYPFKFLLPFSPLGGQTVNLRAQAQMRAESQ